jgi:hypothetical protein
VSAAFQRHAHTSRLVEPFKALSSSTSVLDTTENPPAGFEGAGMGRLVELTKPLPLSEVVSMVKKHLGLSYR